MLDIELGMRVSAGQGIGIVNDLSDYKVVAQIDEHYIGRQNPKHYEILDGLAPGEQVITSTYDAFKDNDVLIIE